MLPTFSAPLPIDVRSLRRRLGLSDAAERAGGGDGEWRDEEGGLARHTLLRDLVIIALGTPEESYVLEAAHNMLRPFAMRELQDVLHSLRTSGLAVRNVNNPHRMFRLSRRFCDQVDVAPDVRHWLVESCDWRKRLSEPADGAQSLSADDLTAGQVARALTMMVRDELRVAVDLPAAEAAALGPTEKEDEGPTSSRGKQVSDAISLRGLKS
jgi:hypothetical protein